MNFCKKALANELNVPLLVIQATIERKFAEKVVEIQQSQYNNVPGTLTRLSIYDYTKVPPARPWTGKGFCATSSLV